jgi:hypothetical protein
MTRSANDGSEDRKMRIDVMMDASGLEYGEISSASVTIGKAAGTRAFAGYSRCSTPARSVLMGGRGPGPSTSFRSGRC